MDKVAVTFGYYDDKGVYASPELFSDWSVATTWTHMSGTFKLADVVKAAGGTITQMPTNTPEIGFITNSSKSDMYIDKLQLVEGTDVPGEKANDNDVYRDQHKSDTPAASSTPTSSTKTNASTAAVSNKPGNNLVSPSSVNTAVASTSGGESEIAVSATSGSENEAAVSGSEAATTGGDRSGGFPWFVAGIIIIAVIVLGGGGVILYFKVFRKKSA